MKQHQARIKELARLLESAAKKHNENADTTCSVAACFNRPDDDLSDEAFDSVFEAVTELAGSSPHKRPDYSRAARELIARIERISVHDDSATRVSPRRKRDRRESK